MVDTPKDDDGGLPRHVLLVEDDPILALSLQDFLQHAGIADVRMCATTEAALQELREAIPDIILLDVHLADRDDGWAIAELVSGLTPNAPKIIFSTASPQDIPASIAEMGPILEKPYEPDDLLMLLREPKKRGIFSRLRNPLG